MDLIDCRKAWAGQAKTAHAEELERSKIFTEDLKAVGTDASNIKNVKDQTRGVCELAIFKDPKSIRFIREQSQLI